MSPVFQAEPSPGVGPGFPSDLQHLPVPGADAGDRSPVHRLRYLEHEPEPGVHPVPRPSG